MTRFEVLGRVAARQDDWAADLPPQQQLLLAVLVMAGGAVVGRKRLEEALWGVREPYPEHGVEKAAYELRRALRQSCPQGDPVPAGDGGYRLLVTPEQADVMRFRAKADGARHASGPANLELMREALREWGPGATGLHGGEPLLGLAGQWADNTRHKLKADYRKAMLYCLTQGTSLEDYDFVLCQCEQLDTDDVKALLDEEFTGLWMHAADRAGHPAMAREIYQRAVEATARAGERPGPALRSLNAGIRAGHTPPGTVSLPLPPEAVPLSTGPGQANEANHEVSKVNEQNQGNDASVRPGTGQQAVQGELGLTARSEIEADRIAEGASVTGVSADPAPGVYESKARVGSIEGQLTGVDLRKRG